MKGTRFAFLFDDGYAAGRSIDISLIIRDRRVLYVSDVERERSARGTLKGLVFLFSRLADDDSAVVRPPSPTSHCFNAT